MAAARRHTPCRTCVGTRQKLPTDQLLRVVVDPDSPGRLIPDPRRRLPGRGAWLRPTLQAFELAEKRRAWRRALRLPGGVDTSEIRAYVIHQAAEESGKESFLIPGEYVRKTEH
ncbi:DUF448 domain-containing protein [Corynebacterium poyangense]|uniref:DUF448 domain-containing protein n=1 Tax=Corynebacterium poyangense TaxID=2684405 RepID=A0A7H0SPG6_9CORY|nr:YlxR family protein [Corynebacterium poyangense]MBZ8178021.1 DUF448 domain-containing protein [Corynebacterium poyangense]QNQ90441.1 DUF448 domain-containing protein [Corynebacterium poyangense]